LVILAIISNSTTAKQRENPKENKESHDDDDRIKEVKGN